MAPEAQDSENLPSSEQIASKTVYIAGAGIAGLTLALALARLGVRVVVLEKTSQLQTEGAGLQISPNARKILNELGLNDALNKHGFATQGIDIYPFKRPTPLISLTLGTQIEKRFGAQYMVIHRADLADILYGACQTHSTIEFQFGVRGFDMEAHQKGLSLTLEYKDGQFHNVRPFAFVGADGVHSATRRAIMGGPEAIYSGYVAWRALIPASLMEGQFDLTKTSLMWGPGYHIVAYPHPNRHVINIALFSKEKLSGYAQTKIVQSPLIPKVGFSCKRTKTIIYAAEGGWKKWPLFAAKTSQWHKGPIGLIGDAAHAMLPYQAQGAAMAIEDAGVLAALLASASNATEAFATFQSLRQTRVNRVVKTSATNGRIYHMEWPFSLARDVVVSLQGPTAHLKRLAWIYEYEVPKLTDLKYHESQ